MRHHLTQLFVISIMLIILFFYYRTELQPFEYQNFDNLISSFQQYDAELDEATVQTRFGLIKHYDAMNGALNGMNSILDQFQTSLDQNPHDGLSTDLNSLQETLAKKEQLISQFTRINPVLRNAVHDFSTLMARIIESEAHLELIESCFDAEYRYSLIDKVNTLFRGVLVYTNAPSEQQRLSMLSLIKEIKDHPETLDNLNKALIYGHVILRLQPKLNQVNLDILALPIVEKLEQLSKTYEHSYQNYQDKLEQSRFFLYGLSILLLIVLHFAFKRLQDMVRQLQVEVQLKTQAQGELAEINLELEQRVKDRTQDLAEKNEDLNHALSELEEAQDQLIMQEKMASVGMLTTGVAHEIKNPLNFINNFSDLSVDLVIELQEEIDKHKAKLDKKTLSYLDEILEDLKTNCTKINQHGQRADNIVKNMLEHSQETEIEKEQVDLNELVQESINVTKETQKNLYDQFECNIVTHFDEHVKNISIARQAITRVFTYLLNNAFYAIQEKKQKVENFKPTLEVSTSTSEGWVIIKFHDNGVGIPQKNLKKIFEPFYTTKPTGRGNTGLGLSICYDTVVKQHKGELSVHSEEGEYTEVVVKLPAS